MYRKTVFFLALLFCFIKLPADEIKGVWIVRWDVDDPMEVFTMMSDLKGYDINTLFVQVYARCEAMYRSRLVPRSTELLNAPFNYDPLDVIIRLAHSEGYQVHAWINLYYAWSHAPFPQTAEHIVNSHPEWLLSDENGINLRNYSVDEIKAKGLEGYFLEPGNEAVHEHLKMIVKEIVENYDIDGIHMDYVRYPGRDYGYDVAARVGFMREYYVDPWNIKNRSIADEAYGEDGFLDLEKKWEDWKRAQVSRTVKEISEVVKSRNPACQVSVAVIGDHTHASEDLSQDWVGWARENYVDFVVPMLYSSSVDWIDRKTKSTMKLVEKEKLVVGLGAYLQEKENLAQEIARVQSNGARGYLLFSYGGMKEKGYFD
jgi:uncharacterized lipoprotein YddW (UPF0748 family)